MSEQKKLQTSDDWMKEAKERALKNPFLVNVPDFDLKYKPIQCKMNQAGNTFIRIEVRLNYNTKSKIAEWCVIAEVLGTSELPLNPVLLTGKQKKTRNNWASRAIQYFGYQNKAGIGQALGSRMVYKKSVTDEEYMKISL